MLVIVFLLALFVRCFNLSEYPVGFQIDEATLGYNTYSILQTGRGETGVFLPLYNSTFNDFYPTGYFYLDLPFISLMGLTVTATRLPAALFGAFSIFAIYYLSFALFRNKKISVLAALLLALNPWHIMLSRGSSESLVALFFVMFGFAFIIDSIRSKKLLSVTMGTLLLSISVFIYHAPRVFIPIFLIAIYVFSYRELLKKRKYALYLLGSFTFLSVLIAFLIFIIPGGTERFKQTSIFTFPETRLVLEEQYREDGVAKAPLLVTRMLHNKPVNYFLAFTSQYMEYFTGAFLFIKGGQPLLFTIPNMGLLYLFELPFLIWGGYSIMKSKDKRGRLILVWLLCAPIVSSLTIDDSPNVRRAINMIPALEIIAAVGIYEAVKRLFFVKSKKVSLKLRYVLVSIVFLFFAFNISYFMHQYFVQSRVHRTWYRNNGFKEMMQVVNSKYRDHDKIFMTRKGGGYPLVLFFSGYDPLTYQKEGSPRDADYKGFGKYVFLPYDCPSVEYKQKSNKIMYVDDSLCPEPLKGMRFTNIYTEDGSLGFRVVY